MIPFSMFLGDEYLGDGLQSYPESVHYFCRKCGTIWARAISSDPSAYHFTMTGHCPEHDDADWAAPILCYEFHFRVYRYPIQALIRDFLYLTDPNKDRVISHNLPGITHDQHQAA